MCTVVILAACTRTEVLGPAEPRVVAVSSSPFTGATLPEDGYVSVIADWQGACRRHDAGLLKMLDAFTKQGPSYSVPCDVKEFAMDLQCSGACVISSTDSTARDRMHVDHYRGDGQFIVRPLDAHLQVSVTLRHARQSYHFDSPRFEVPSRGATAPAWSTSP